MSPGSSGGRSAWRISIVTLHPSSSASFMSHNRISPRTLREYRPTRSLFPSFLIHGTILAMSVPNRKKANYRSFFRPHAAQILSKRPKQLVKFSPPAQIMTAASATDKMDRLGPKGPVGRGNLAVPRLRDVREYCKNARQSDSTYSARSLICSGVSLEVSPCLSLGLQIVRTSSIVRARPS